nr:hypothetical protein [Tanacetum cinerariifolium]
MVKMVSHEAFACSCAEGDVVLRQSYKPKSCASETFWMCIFLWKETRLRQLMGSPRAPSAGPSTPPSYSSGPLTGDFSPLLTLRLFKQLKKDSKKDKIGSKPDKAGKRGEAEKSLKQLQ